MNQWAFVTAAYAIVLSVTAILLVASWRTMRRAEAEADAVRDQR